MYSSDDDDDYVRPNLLVADMHSVLAHITHMCSKHRYDSGSPTTVARVLEDFLYPSIHDPTIRITSIHAFSHDLALATDLMQAHHFIHTLLIDMFDGRLASTSHAMYTTSDFLAEKLPTTTIGYDFLLFASDYTKLGHLYNDTIQEDALIAVFVALDVNPLGVYLVEQYLRVKTYTPLVAHCPTDGHPIITRIATHLLQHINPANGFAWQYLYACTDIHDIDIAGVSYNVDHRAFMHSVAAYQNITVAADPRAVIAIKTAAYHTLRVHLCFPDQWSCTGRGQPRAPTRTLPDLYAGLCMQTYPAETRLFSTLLLAIQRLLPATHHHIWETTLEDWTLADCNSICR